MIVNVSDLVFGLRPKTAEDLVQQMRRGARSDLVLGEWESRRGVKGSLSHFP